MATNTKHTPGPWRVVKTRQGGLDVTQLRCNRSIAMLYGTHVASRSKKSWANAALLSAAPELLECAKILAVVACEDGFPNEDERANALKKVIAAIAKATGK